MKKKGLTDLFIISRFECTLPILNILLFPYSDLHDLLVSNEDEMSKISTALDLNRKLSYELPFPDIRPTIILDDFLPRIFDLSLDAKDRRTRMAACEVLHVMIIYIIGK